MDGQYVGALLAAPIWPRINKGICIMSGMTQRSRRTIRLRDYDYSQAGAYFVTVCTYQRECIFGGVIDAEMRCNAIGQIVVDTWRSLPPRFAGLVLDEFVVMPNHLHGVLHLGDGAASVRVVLGAVIRAFKSQSAIAANRLLQRPGQPLWQRNYFERVVRDEEELQRIRDYIVNNPACWGEDTENPTISR